MQKAEIIAAIGTPLATDESLLVEGLSEQIRRCRRAGIDGFFAAGTLGVMPMLAEQTYRDLVEHAVRLNRQSGPLLVGASDLGYARTRERILFLNDFNVDGVVVLPPYFFRFTQQELIDYYRALADDARAPLYLYDLPQRTYAPIEVETVLTLARHPNIAGIKCSGPFDQVEVLVQQLKEQDVSLKVIIAQPDRLAQHVSQGYRHHLDGLYALAPKLTRRIADGSSCDPTTSDLQNDLTELRDVMRTHGGLSALTVLMNAVGVPGNFAPRPFRTLDDECRERLLAEPIVKRFLTCERVPQLETVIMDVGRSPRFEKQG